MITMTYIAMDALQFIKCFLNASSHFILHQPSDGVCVFMTFILHVRPSEGHGSELPEFII